MKKILLSLAFVASAYGFAANYHSERGELHSHVSINEIDGKTVFEDEILGKVNLNKASDGYESDNGSVIVKDLKDGKINVKQSILFYDRHTTNKEKFPQPGLYFHSYNKNFGHVHIDVDKDYKTVEINHQKFRVNKQELNGDIILVEEHGAFRFVIHGKYDALKDVFNYTVATFTASIDYFPLKGDFEHHHKHDHHHDHDHDHDHNHK